MSPAGRRQVEELFLDLLEVPEAERAAELERRCGGDAELREGVSRLLRIEAASPRFLDAPPVPAAPTGEPMRIGSYEIVGTLGEGGMGMVYEARQASPSRTVALKIIRPGFGGVDLVRRLRREAQALGLLHHAGIACIYEAGAAAMPGLPGPQPFIAMELVRGRSITDFARETHLTPRQRADLVARVADAVQHAHERGVIHRDLKPRNIFVDASGQPKVLDFGIAKLVGDAAGAATVHTATGGILGTLDYMSPEQVAGEPHQIDARSDVYALGAILFELLAGHPPHRVGGLPVPEALRVIRDEDAPRLSRLRAPDASARFDEDLGTVVGKALEKDPLRRYASAAALAADIRHYLSDEPIVARPTTAMYQVRKFAQRNKALVGGVAATVAALAVGLVGTTRYAARESAARRLAEDRLTQATLQSYRASLAAAQASIESGDLPSALGHLDAAPAASRGWEWRLSRRMADPAETVVARRADGVRPEAVDAARRLAAGTVGSVETGAIRVWDLPTGADLPVRWPEGRGTPVGFVRGGAALLTAKRGGELTLIDVGTGAVIWSVTHGPWGPRPGLSGDGARLALASTDGAVSLISTEDGSLVRRYSLPPSPVEVRLSHDGRLMSCGYFAGFVVFDLEAGRVAWEGNAFFQSFSQDGRQAVLARQDAGGRPAAIVVDALTGAEVRRFDLASIGAWSQMAALSPEGERIAHWQRTSGLTITEVATGDVLAQLPVDALGATFWFEPDGRALHAVSSRGGWRRWTLPPTVGVIPHATWTAGARASSVSDDARLVARTDWGSVALLDAASGRVKWRRALGNRTVDRAAFEPGGTRLAVHDGDQSVVVIATDDGRVLERLEAPGRPRAVSAMAWGAAGLVVAWEDGEVTEHRSESLRGAPRTIARAEGVVRLLAPLPGGSVVAGAVAPRPAEPGRPVEPWTIQLFGGSAPAASLGPAEPSALRVSRDGARLLIAMADGSVAVMPAGSGPVRPLAVGGASRLLGIDESPDGSRIAALDANGAVLFWDVAGGPPLVSIRLRLDSTGAGVRFAADGESLLLASGGASAVLRTSPGDLDAIGENERWRRAVRLVETRRSSLLVASSVERSLREDATLSPALASAAIEACRALGDSGALLNSSAWAAVRAPGAAEAQVRQALEMARAAHASIPDSPAAMNTLGAALHRLGRHAEAVEALSRADAMFAARGRRSRVANFALLALAEHAQRHDARARAALDRARALAADEPPDADAARLLDEAQAALGPPPKAP